MAERKNVSDDWKNVDEAKVASPFEGKVVDKAIEGRNGEPYSVRKK